MSSGRRQIEFKPPVDFLASNLSPRYDDVPSRLSQVRIQRLQLALSHLKDPELSRLSSVKEAHVKLMQVIFVALHINHWFEESSH